jgi:4-hydroxy-3-polyprenylbenzoate decarboxylase
MGKLIVAVDDDVDTNDLQSIVWALAFRMQPHRDVRILGDRLARLDPSMPAELGAPPAADASAMLIDATRGRPYPPTSRPSKEYMEGARRLWERIGLPALDLAEPWYGYELGDWTDENREEAALAVLGQYLTTGAKLSG